MKRFAAFVCAVVALVAGVVSIPAIFKCTAHAFEYITLTPAQTRALFGDDIAAEYIDSSGVSHSEYFRYYGSGISPSHEGYHYLIYVGDFTSSPSGSNDNLNWIIHLEPSVGLSGLNYFEMDVGFRVTGAWTLPYSRVQKNKVVVSTDANSPAFSSVNFEMAAGNQGGYNYVAYIRDIVESSSNETWKFSYINVILANINRTFSVSLYDINRPADYGVFQNGMYDRIDGECYMMIQCPLLSDDYTIDSSNGSSPDSSNSGSDYPDYSEQLALILAKLDLIVNNDFNFDVDLSADLSGLESRLDGVNSRLDGSNSRLDGVNSRLDGSNSRLDGVNSRLDGSNSRLDGVNSRLDNISGELHDLNSAPSETIPNTGGENSEFEHQAEMYMSDFRNEFEDSENQAMQVIDKGTGFLGFVRQFIISSHLAQILPLVALLFIVHYVIFEKGG